METTMPRMEPPLVQITEFQPLQNEEHVSKILEETKNIIYLEIASPDLKLKRSMYKKYLKRLPTSYI
jgi:hypothetical protein